MADFAADYERNDKGWILFPRDVERRRELFPQEVFKHPAKNNLFLTEELIYYLTEPEDHILDPFGGTGTTMVAALHGRPTTLIDIEPCYTDLMNQAILKWVGMGMESAPISFRCGDCRQVLPIPCDAVITSPPFSTVITRGKSALASHKEDLDLFVASPQNLANLNPFYYGKALNKVFQGIAASLPSGGPLAIISRDFCRGGDRVLLSSATIKQAQANGLKYKEWFKWKPPGSAQRRIQESRGAMVIEDEDILIFRKE